MPNRAPQRAPLFAAIGFGLLMPACGGRPVSTLPADASASGSIDAAPIQSAAAFAPNPLDVEVVLDKQRAQSAVVGAQGGEVRATAGDGTSFRLVIPPDGVARERQITLTPVSAITGYPFGGTPFAVHMEPEGLQLLGPATLRIEGPTMNPDELIGFGYSATGGNFHLVPVATDGSALVLRIWHFSGAGVGTAAQQERAEQQARAPIDYEQYVQQELAILLKREISACWVGLCEDPEFTTLTDEERRFVERLLEGWWQLLEETIRAGETDCMAFKRGTAQLLAWERGWQMLGVSETDARIVELEPSIFEGARNCIREAYDKCRSAHDLDQVTVMYEILKTSRYVEAESELEALAEDLGGKCATFELEYAGHIVWQAQLSGTYGVAATVPLALDMASRDEEALEDSAEGSAELVVREAAGWPDPDAAPCAKEVTGPSGDKPFEVRDVEWTWSTPSKDGGRTITQLVLAVDPGTLEHRLIVTCPHASPPPVDYGHLYAVGFFNLHRPESAGDANPYLTNITFSPGDILGGELYAERTYSRSGTEEDVTIQGDFTFELWHRPPPVSPPDP